MSNAFRARRLPVILTIVAAMMLAIVPLPGWAEPFRPDWVAITLIYWCLHMPRYFGVGSAWLVGIVLDVAQGTLLGQHALALSLIAFLTVKFHLQLRVFPLSQMAATVLALLAVYRFVLFWINGVAGVGAPLVAYWGPVLTGTLLWPVADFILRTIPRRRRPSG
ncbi:MAG: rod shape-determining protein MreD [Gammaproteobacteria bacterium]|nr:rod shape-determining protein MreD [Gammaproteobacteria bacterium]MDH4254424.1 rod shape-determining protein MreD [Gammaproteobacteria bacterium]MDH5311085.1 rod shape-determining protein MreD [Gammaproteobacteria bacterium]